MPPITLRATEQAIHRVVGRLTVESVTYSTVTRPMFWGAAPSAADMTDSKTKGKAISSVRSLGKAGLPSKMGFG